MKATSVLVLVVLTAACAGAPPSGARAPSTRPSSVTTSGSTTEVFLAPDLEVTSEKVEASPEAVWAALKEVYAELGIPVDADQASRTLHKARFVVSRRLAGTPLSRYLECGAGITGSFADAYRIEMRIRSAVVEVAGETRIETLLEARARNPEGASSSAVACASTHRLEGEIAERVRTRVGA